ncbi:MAG TPA: DUF433 domain-containing protein [Candidatus Angelobacter sp.]|nr:DUF433 domain-containing protein [Candidatus Angelobacter sp.]
MRIQSSSVVSVFPDKEMGKLLSVKYRAGVDSREQPLYTTKEAARYLGIEHQTLSNWLFGRYYPVKGGKRFWEPVITAADPELKLLSFFNLAEAHVLAATRYEHKVPFWAVRDAIASVIESIPAASKHPLLSDEFFTNGKLLFVKKISEYVNISSKQLSLDIMDSFLVRVLKDDTGPFKVFPLRPNEPHDRVISITAGVRSSRPILDDSAVPVLAIWRRFKAGEDEKFIAEDLEIEESKVRRAIKYIEWKAA